MKEETGIRSLFSYFEEGQRHYNELRKEQRITRILAKEEVSDA
jgi:hypothetical protein